MLAMSIRPSRRTLKVAGSILGSAIFIFVAGMGFLHTKPGRPYLIPVFGFLGMECPVGNVPRATILAQRNDGIRKERGNTVAPARPALGFELESTTQADVTAWAKRQGVICTEKQEGAVLSCPVVPATLFGGAISDTPGEMAFGFSIKEHKLINLSVTRLGLTGADAATQFNRTADVLRRALGEPKRKVSRPDAAFFKSVGFATTSLEYRFVDYFADLSCTAMPKTGVLCREHYMSAKTE